MGTTTVGCNGRTFSLTPIRPRASYTHGIVVPKLAVFKSPDERRPLEVSQVLLIESKDYYISEDGRALVHISRSPRWTILWASLTRVVQAVPDY